MPVKVHSYDVLFNCKTVGGAGPRVNADHDLALLSVVFSCVLSLSHMRLDPLQS